MMRQLLLEVRVGVGEVLICPDAMVCMHQQLYSPGLGKLVAGGADSIEWVVCAHIMARQPVLR